MEFSERIHQTLVYSSTIFPFIQYISYLKREKSANCELISCSIGLVPFLLQSFKTPWIDLTLNCAYSHLYINDLKWKLLSIINNAIHKVLISTLFQTSVTNL